MALKKRPMLVVIAAVLAGGTGLIAFDYLSTARASSAVPPQRPVLVASRPVNAREAITSAMVQVQMRPANAVDPGAYSTMNQVVGRRRAGGYSRRCGAHVFKRDARRR